MYTYFVKELEKTSLYIPTPGKEYTPDYWKITEYAHYYFEPK